MLLRVVELDEPAVGVVERDGTTCVRVEHSWQSVRASVRVR